MAAVRLLAARGWAAAVLGGWRARPSGGVHVAARLSGGWVLARVAALGACGRA